MKTSSKFKRMACVMMSALTLATGFGAGNLEVGATSPSKDALKMAKSVNDDNLRLLSAALKIFANEEKETWASLDQSEKKTIMKFFEKALDDVNPLQLKMEAFVKKTGMMQSVDAYMQMFSAIKDMVSDQDTTKPKNEPTSLTTAFKINSSISDDDQQILFDVTGRLKPFPKNGTNETKEKYSAALYNNFKISFQSIVKSRIEELDYENQGIIKQLLSNPLFIIFAGVMIIKFGAEGFNMLRGFVSEAKHKAQTEYRKATAKGFDLDHYPELLDRIEKRLRTELVGQDEAITKVIEIMRGHFQSMVEAKALGKEYEHGLLLYLVGSPATGKSTMMKIIQEEIGISCFSSKMSDIVEDRGNDAQNVAAILTKPTKIPTTSGTTIEKDAPLIEQLKLYVSTLYLIDEIDKMRKYDAQLQDLTNNKNIINIVNKEQDNALDKNKNNINIVNKEQDNALDKNKNNINIVNKEQDNALDKNKNNINIVNKERENYLDKNKNNNIYSIDEIIRNFIDTGYLAGYDAKGSIVCVTSNETDEDIDELESSLRNRYAPYRVNFKDFNKEDYLEIIRRGSVELQEYYSKTFDTTIDWDNNAINYFANKFVEESAGGRCTAPLMMKVRSALMLFRKNSDIDISGKRLSINIDKQNNIAIALG